MIDAFNSVIFVWLWKVTFSPSTHCFLIGFHLLSKYSVTLHSLADLAYAIFWIISSTNDLSVAVIPNFPEVISPQNVLKMWNKQIKMEASGNSAWKPLNKFLSALIATVSCHLWLCLNISAIYRIEIASSVTTIQRATISWSPFPISTRNRHVQVIQLICSIYKHLFILKNIPLTTFSSVTILSIIDPMYKVQ